MGEGETNAAAAWFLSAADRGNPAARIDRGASAAGWSAGNRVEVLVDGATYFSRLYRELCSLRAEKNTTLVVATHDEKVAARAARVIRPRR